MKYVLLFAILSPLFSIGQDSLLYQNLPVIDGKVTYEKVIALDSVSKDALFMTAKDWAVDAYRSQKATLQAEDKAGGYLAYKGYLPVYLEYRGGILKGKKYGVDLYHTLKFYIKDGKTKVVFTDLKTVSKDIGSSMMNVEEQRPIEIWEDDIKDMKGKKHVKYKEWNELNARDIDLQIQTFLVALGKELQKKKTGFDF
jgi:hypothetical protein